MWEEKLIMKKKTLQFFDPKCLKTTTTTTITITTITTIYWTILCFKSWKNEVTMGPPVGHLLFYTFKSVWFSWEWKNQKHFSKSVRIWSKIFNFPEIYNNVKGRAIRAHWIWLIYTESMILNGLLNHNEMRYVLSS